jgi:hypothetical protein
MKIKKKKLRILNTFTNCSELFKTGDGRYPIVQYKIGDHGDVYLDVRLIKSTRQRGFVILTCNGGVRGVKQALLFLMRKRKRILRVIRGARRIKGFTN